MHYLGTWFSGEQGSAKLTVGLKDLKDLFQPKWCYDSNLWFCKWADHGS